MVAGRVALLFAGLVFAVLFAVPRPVGAQSAAAETLIRRYAPVVMWARQDAQCDTDGEPYVALPVNVVLDDPQVTLRQNITGDPVVKAAPSESDLVGLDDTYYLDFPGDALDAECDFERWQDARITELGLTPSTYARIAINEDGDRLAIQYWFWYVYNDFNNKHEGDWEMIQVVFDVGTVEEALQTDPVETGYAQHGGGESAAWDSEKLTLIDETHPLVYTARGSHASQYDSAVYLGWGENGTGFGCDRTDADADQVPLEPIMVVDTAGTPQAWMAYEGRWGERHKLMFNGPNGPNMGGKWADPFAWQDRLRTSSLAVPLAGALGPAPTSAFCSVAAINSRLLELALRNLALAILLIVVAIAIPVLLLRSCWDVLAPAFRFYGRNLAAFVPAGAAVVVVGIVASLSNSLVGLLLQRGPLSRFPDIWSAFSLATSVLQSAISLVLVAPLTIATVVALRKGTLEPVRERLAEQRQVAPRFFRSILRPAAVIAAASLLPLGGLLSLYMLVRRMFLPQALIVDNATRQEGEQTSKRMVRRRWWTSTALVLVVTSLVVIPGVALGIFVMVYFSQSITLINVLSSLIYALVYPFVFVAITLYFLRIREQDAGTATEFTI